MFYVIRSAAWMELFKQTRKGHMHPWLHLSAKTTHHQLVSKCHRITPLEITRTYQHKTSISHSCMIPNLNKQKEYCIITSHNFKRCLPNPSIQNSRHALTYHISPPTFWTKLFFNARLLSCYRVRVIQCFIKKIKHSFRNVPINNFSQPIGVSTWIPNNIYLGNIYQRC